MKALLKDFNGRPPAKQKAILAAEKSLKKKLPAGYLEFLAICNGGEGFIGENAYVILYGVHELAGTNRDYEVEEYAPGFLIFGSDGGDEAFGFDTRKKSWPIVQIPFIGMDWELAEKLGASFSAFLKRLSKS